MSGCDDLNEVYVPSADVCAFCSDSECDGVGCIAALDPDDERDIPRIEHLHAVLRAGHAFMGADRVLAHAENRPYTDEGDR